jgi:hypothetical protein
MSILGAACQEIGAQLVRLNVKVEQMSVVSGTLS